jgi:hypothetical protein
MCGVYPNSNGACAACIRDLSDGNMNITRPVDRIRRRACSPVSVMIGDGVVCGKGKIHFSHSQRARRGANAPPTRFSAYHSILCEHACLHGRGMPHLASRRRAPRELCPRPNTRASTLPSGCLSITRMGSRRCEASHHLGLHGLCRRQRRLAAAVTGAMRPSSSLRSTITYAPVHRSTRRQCRRTGPLSPKRGSGYRKRS